jgi:hypothetical protein
MDGERPSSTQHPLISRVAVPPRDPDSLRNLSPDAFLLLGKPGGQS